MRPIWAFTGVEPYDQPCANRRAYNVKTRSGEMNFRSAKKVTPAGGNILGGNPITDRDAFYKMLKSVLETSKLTFDQCVEIMTKGQSVSLSSVLCVRLYLG
jgi:hypothetical protein